MDLVQQEKEKGKKKLIKQENHNSGITFFFLLKNDLFVFVKNFFLFLRLIWRRKWAFAPFAKTFQQNASYLKLFREMPLF